MRDVASRQHPREFATDQRIVVAEAAGAMREVHAQRERGEGVLAADGNVRQSSE